MHMEEAHAEGESPFVVRDGASASTGVSAEQQDFALCPVDGCEEHVVLAELDDHLELHNAEEDLTPNQAPVTDTRASSRSRSNEYRSPYSGSGSGNSTSKENMPPRKDHAADHQADDINRENGTVNRWKQILSMPSATRKRLEGATAANGVPKKRLGKSELGRYAHEDVMPGWLVQLLKEKGQVSQSGMVPVLAQILEQSKTTKYAYLCHPAVNHISKLKREGGFCGYRNIQMLSSYIVGRQAPGAAQLNGKIPTIFKIQDLIENAWDRGINTQGRIETGGVRGTRKYIGTPEAQALFLSLDIPCNAQGFKDPHPGTAEAQMLRHVEDYFMSGDFDPEAKVRKTSLPPIYFQHRGHSMTIVGIEKRADGTRELLVFDPMFHDSDSLVKHVGSRREFKVKSPDSSLKLYRRGNKYLKRFHEFELLKLTSRIPSDSREQEETLAS
ncbi:uncharacterized protein JN550_012890 [Neoarthrinium moseri]|uniref:uncharacterized protein n=1 Tax=Neoarthrinium moseri TaxID=1658444 RepID=UPI001FDDCD06|nr:uncharacterized protein JN550_012890 [Neoarthrinium moseri]KAI1858068.1 hypothetical protein JN550_012890 [Neoarthrinium moseri]